MLCNLTFCWELNYAHHTLTTQHLIRTFVSLLAPASLGNDGFLSHHIAALPPAVQLRWRREGARELGTRMPKPASLPVFWVPPCPLPGAINNTLNEMGGSGIPVARPSGIGTE